VKRCEKFEEKTHIILNFAEAQETFLDKAALKRKIYAYSKGAIIVSWNAAFWYRSTIRVNLRKRGKKRVPPTSRGNKVDYQCLLQNCTWLINMGHNLTTSVAIILYFQTSGRGTPLHVSQNCKPLLPLSILFIILFRTRPQT